MLEATPTTIGGREDRIFRLSTFHRESLSPFHIPTDIGVVIISCAKSNVADYTKSKCTFDLQSDTVQVPHCKVGAWATRKGLTWSKWRFDDDNGGWGGLEVWKTWRNEKKEGDGGS